MSDQVKGSRKKVDLDWDNRVLCSDGSCIGVIGPDGRCKECGKVYEGDLPSAEQPVDDEPTHADASHEPTEEEPLAVETQSSASSADLDASSSNDDDWDQRTLCSDGNCIGVIASDGRCKECGKPYAG